LRKDALSFDVLIVSSFTGYNSKSIGGGTFWHRSNSGSAECKYNLLFLQKTSGDIVTIVARPCNMILFL
jgi:hypothetical protein